MGKDSGGGGGYEAPDSLKSRATAEGIDLICEGPIKGLVNEYKSVYINDTPLENGDGTRNFPRVNIWPRYGTLTQDAPRGISSSESEHAVNQKISIVGGPVVRQIAEADIDSLRVTISIPALAFVDTTTGNTTGTSVAIKFELQPNGGAWNTLPLFFQSVGATWNAGGFWVSGPLAYRMQIAFRATVQWNVPDPAGAFVTFASQYRLQGSGTWITFETRTVHSGTANYFGEDYVAEQITDGTMTISFRDIPGGIYEFRVVKTAGSGDVFIGPGYVDGEGVAIPLPADAFGYAEVLTISGKAGSKYQRSVVINPKEVGAGPWNLRITRLTPDSASQFLQNETWWESYTEIQDEVLTYPNTAIMGFSVDAKQFPSVPKRAYDLYLMIVKIPSNYNPVTKQYTGVWDGTFTTGWTDNPAWCFYDLVTNARYGLGDYIPASMVDKWALYTIGQYCDALIPSGRKDALGNIIYEPRFTLNCLIFNREQAFQAIGNLASVFRGMAYWAGGSIVAVQDAPSDPVALFTPANVVGGMFQYAGTSKRARHTAALVTWNDPANMYKTAVELVDDKPGIARYGYNPVNLGAFGCTSQGMANRVGRWLLYTEQSETEVVTFRTGINSAYLRPGNAILVADPDRAGVRFGGRIASATASALTLDATVTLAGGQTYSVSVELIDGTVQSRVVTNAAGVHTVLNLASALSSAPAPNAVWIITASNVEPQTFKVLALAEANRGEIEVTALSHNPDKYAHVEQGLALGSPPITVRPPPDKVEPPINLLATFSEIIVNPDTRRYRLNVSWQKSPSPHTSEYICEYRFENNNWAEIMPESRSLMERHVDNLVPGIYEVRVCAINLLGVRSTFVYANPTLGSSVLPLLPDPLFNDARCTYTDKIQLEWFAIPDPILGYFELRTDLNWGNQTGMLYQGKGTTYTMKPTGASYTFYLRAHDTLLAWSANYDSIVLVLTVPVPIFVSLDDTKYGRVRIEWEPINDESYDVVEVWRSGTNDRATSVLVGQVHSNVYADMSVAAGVIYYYWLRTKSLFATYSVWESGINAGRMATTATLNLTEMMDVLTGNITTEALSMELQTLIEYVDPNTYFESGTFESGVIEGWREGLFSEHAFLRMTVSDVAGIAGQMTLAASQWTVKLNANGHIAGVGLILDPISVLSQFIVIADEFAVVQPGDEPGTLKVPFIIGTVDGVSQVGINGSLLVDGTIFARSLVAHSVTIDKLTFNNLSGLDPTAATKLGTIQTGADVTLMAIQGTLTIAGGGIILGSSGAMIRSGNFAQPNDGDTPGAGFRFSDSGNIEAYGLTQTFGGAIISSDGNYMVTIGKYLTYATGSTKRYPLNSDSAPDNFDPDGKIHVYHWDAGAGRWVENAAFGLSAYGSNYTSAVKGVASIAGGVGVMGIGSAGSGYVGAVGVKGSDGGSVPGFGGRFISYNGYSVYAESIGTTVSPLLLGPGPSADAPTHGALLGALWVTSSGVLYINTSGSDTWEKVGAQ